MHAQGVEPHPHHGFQVGAPVFAVVNRDAIQEVRPGHKPARAEARLRLPRLPGGRQIQECARLQGIDLAVQPKERPLPLQEIKHGVENRLRRGAGKCTREALPAPDGREIS